MKPISAFFGGFALITVFALLLGCATGPKFENPADYIGASYASIKAAANTAGQLYESGRISHEQGQELANLLIEAWNVTVMAESLLAEGKPEDAMATLQVAQRFLTMVEQKLREMQE